MPLPPTLPPTQNVPPVCMLCVCVCHRSTTRISASSCWGAFLLHFASSNAVLLHSKTSPKSPRHPQDPEERPRTADDRSKIFPRSPWSAPRLPQGRLRIFPRAPRRTPQEVPTSSREAVSSVLVALVYIMFEEYLLQARLPKLRKRPVTRRRLEAPC